MLKEVDQERCDNRGERKRYSDNGHPLVKEGLLMPVLFGLLPVNFRVLNRLIQCGKQDFRLFQVFELFPGLLSRWRRWRRRYLG
ncbi:hypothetical protein AB0O38_09010 [Pseudarthrobacter oxydans]|uniref:hypothetical protein n=1 Tax=Pseudarthrobacter oxydans TaxID=1671 RepID=UPI00342A0AA7